MPKQACGRDVGVSGCQGREVRGDVCGPPLSRVVVGQGCLARFTCPWAEACCPMGRRQSTIFESLRRPRANLSELERRRLSDEIFPPPPTKQYRAV